MNGRQVYRRDVVVVGGGAMGSAAAWRLAGRGADVVLLERFEPGHVQGASHGASRIFRLSYPYADYISLARTALVGWRVLEQASGVPLLELTGGVDHGEGPAVPALAAALASAGVPGELLHPEQARERWPGMRFDGQVFHHPTSGRLHADRAVAALQREAARLGAEVRHQQPVERIAARGTDLVEVNTSDATYLAGRVVVAVGAWTHRLLGDLVRLPPLRVTEEQPAHFAPRDPRIDWPSFVHHGHPAANSPGMYGLATPGEGVKVGFHGDGPACDPDRRTFRPDPARLSRLREYARDWLPGVDPLDAAPISCTYTTTPSSDFVVDRAGPVVVAAGFSGHGFKFVPAIGRLVADLALTDREPPARFALPA